MDMYPKVCLYMIGIYIQVYTSYKISRNNQMQSKNQFSDILQKITPEKELPDYVNEIKDVKKIINYKFNRLKIDQLNINQQCRLKIQPQPS